MLNNYNCIIIMSETCFIQEHLPMKTIYAQEIIIGSKCFSIVSMIYITVSAALWEMGEGGGVSYGNV